MPLDNLRAFVDAIAAAGELARVERPVSVDKEMTEIADRCMKSPGGGPALLFRHPTLRHGGPSRYPVAVNLFGSARRMALALGVECLDDIGERIAAIPPRSMRRRRRSRPRSTSSCSRGSCARSRCASARP